MTVNWFILLVEFYCYPVVKLLSQRIMKASDRGSSNFLCIFVFFYFSCGSELFGASARSDEMWMLLPMPFFFCFFFKDGLLNLAGLFMSIMSEVRGIISDVRKHRLAKSFETTVILLFHLVLSDWVTVLCTVFYKSSRSIISGSIYMYVTNATPQIAY